ncbi:MAG: Hsp20/alpha crystallin family protein [Gemmataceae bacterium]|nr:Hsp20/alpha crystallin family protein [Gemmataceae bacterium]
MLPVLRNGTLAPVNRLSSLFDRLFDAPAAPAWQGFPLSVWEDEDHVRVEADAPGMTEKDIEVTFHQGELVIRGERSQERKEAGYDSRTYGRFEQRVSLPCPIQADKAQAKLANGVLSLSFPKAEDAKPRRIALKAE